MKQYNINIESTMDENAVNYNVGDIVASEEFTLSNVESPSRPKKQFGSHYVYVTDVEDSGVIIVSSWGKKYIFNNENAEWTSSVSIKASK